MKQSKIKKAISLIEVSFIVFVLFFIYTFVIKQMLADLKFSDLKRTAGITFTVVDAAARDIMYSGGFANRFKNDSELVNAFAREMNIERLCENSQNEDCWSANWIWSTSKKPGIKLYTGQYVVGELTSPTCISSLNIPNTCGALYIDTNGPKAPNRIGHDMIKIYITENGLIPAGTKDDIINPARGCDMINKFNWGCSARLLGVK